MENLSRLVTPVAEDFAELVVPVADEETAKAQLTRRIAYVLHQANPNLGLVSKSSGNAVNGRTTDVVMDRTDGSSVDVATAVSLDGEARTRVQIRPVWFPYKANPDPRWLARWVEPTAAIRDEPGPLPLREPQQPADGGGQDPGKPEEGGTGSGPVEVNPELALLLARDAAHHAELLAAIREVVQALQDIRRDIQNGAQTLEKLAAGTAISDILGGMFGRKPSE
jgi:hypothetical protein